ncbi:MAG TPA: asparaginase [Anaeromyxobacteraceae bacterium]|nr:asparaginase [Anaeromyxobacteraceae bacterium]
MSALVWFHRFSRQFATLTGAALILVGWPAAAAEPAAKALPVVRLIATGGTIAMKIDPVKKAPVPAISGEDLVAIVPEIGEVAKVEVENLSNVPSDYMDPPRWVELQKSVVKALARPEVAGVIVSHGTDTLEETAYFLDLTVPGEKPVVLIGAQRNASERDFDGPRNLLNAARICVSPHARGKGAMIALNNQVNAAREVTKAHTSSVETFRSGDFGFLGVADNDRVVFYRAPARRQHLPLVQDKLPYVEIVAMYGGADGAMIRAALAAGAKGIVVQALGWGNMNVPMYEAVQEAIGKGVPVVIATRVPTGRVLPVYGFKGGGKTLQEAGAVFADDLSPHKARLLLMLALQTTSKAPEIQKLFDR